jgi:hypothetical protein
MKLDVYCCQFIPNTLRYFPATLAQKTVFITAESYLNIALKTKEIFFIIILNAREFLLLP